MDSNEYGPVIGPEDRVPPDERPQRLWMLQLEFVWTVLCMVVAACCWGLFLYLSWRGLVWPALSGYIRSAVIVPPLFSDFLQWVGAAFTWQALAAVHRRYPAFSDRPRWDDVSSEIIAGMMVDDLYLAAIRPLAYAGVAALLGALI